MSVGIIKCLDLSYHSVDIEKGLTSYSYQLLCYKNHQHVKLSLELDIQFFYGNFLDLYCLPHEGIFCLLPCLVCSL